MEQNKNDVKDRKKGDLLLKVDDLSIEYFSGNNVSHAANDVSFELHKGESLGVVGESGCGKSTVAKAILRILPDHGARIAKGSIMYKGEDLVTMPEKRMEKIRGAEIAMVFQDPMTALNPVRRIINQISGVIRLHNPGISKSEAEDRGIAILKEVGITSDRARDYPHQLSGGQQQRVVCAIALCCNPELLLADEPTTALDVTIQAQILDMMKDLIVNHDTAMILITHNLGIVADTCDNVAVFYGGEIVEYGASDEIFLNPRHPYTFGLFDAIPNLDSKSRRLKPIPGIMPEPSDLPAGCKFHTRCPYATEECLDGPVPTVSLGGTHICRCHNIEAAKEAHDKEKEATA